MSINDILQHKPNFKGTVVEVYNDTSLLVAVNKDDTAIKIADKIQVSLEDITTNLLLMIRYLYTMTEVLQSYPPIISKVYEIFLKDSRFLNQ